MDKNEIIQSMTNVTFYPTVEENHTQLASYTKIPITQIAGLGASFEPLISSFTSGGGAELCKVVIPKGCHLAARTDGTGLLGSALSNATNQVAGQATINPIAFNPAMACMAVALANIDKKLDAIEENQKDMMEFLSLKESAELKGNLNFLSDILNNYKYNWNNEKYKASNHIKVLDIKQSAEQKIDFYRERITSKLEKKSLLHLNQEVKKQLFDLADQFKDYQMAVYLYGFSSFLEVMLLENFDSNFLNGIADKIDKYALSYRELYSKSYDVIEKYSKSSAESLALKGLSGISKFSGNTAEKLEEKIPVLAKVKLSDSLQEGGEKLASFDEKMTSDLLQQFVNRQKSNVQPFIDNINAVNQIYNDNVVLLYDKDNVYVEKRLLA